MVIVPAPTPAVGGGGGGELPGWRKLELTLESADAAAPPGLASELTDTKLAKKAFC